MNKIGIILVVGSIAILFLHFATDYYAVDMCLDSGQVYDYALSQCRDDVDHLPYIPYAERFSYFITVTIAVFVIGIALIIFEDKRNGR